MTTSNTQSPTDPQTHETITSLKSEIDSLKSLLAKKDERIATLDTMLNQVVRSHTIQVRGYEDLEDKMEDVIDRLRKRVPHGEILEFLKVADSNEYQFRGLW